MSLGYAEKLSLKEDVGTVGLPEIFDPPVALHHKIERLAAMILECKHLVAFTGAGISTSCGLPDFRGREGIWTLQRQGKGIPQPSLPFDRAMPSTTHMALVELVRVGILKFIITQNVDGLHTRSGIPREKLAELNGNSFRETCPSCKKEYIRDFEVETIGMKKTPRHCSGDGCKERLRDSVLDWEDELPSKEMHAAEKYAQAADLVLCLGTSLQTTPACDIPSKALQAGGKIAIVNLQQTPKDKDASLVIHGHVDEVMSAVMHYLNLRIPPFVRVDLFRITLTHFLRLSDKRYMKWTLRVSSHHGFRAPLPFIKTVEVSFPGRPELKTAVLSKQPFILKREMIKERPFTIMLKLNFGDGCGTRYTNVEFPVNFQAAMDNIDYGKEVIVRMLKDTAIGDQCCGQISLVDRKALPSPKGEAATYAVATDLVWQGNSFAFAVAPPPPQPQPQPLPMMLQLSPQHSLALPFASRNPVIPTLGTNGNLMGNSGLKRKLPDLSSGPAELVPQSKSAAKDFRPCDMPFWVQNLLLSHPPTKQ